MRDKTRGLWLIGLVVLSPCLGGFDLSRHGIDVEHIVDTDLAKDEIPALLVPALSRPPRPAGFRLGMN